MTTVTVSPTFQVVIPQFLRDALGIHPGQRIRALQHDDRIELIPLPPMSKARENVTASDTQVDSYVPRTELGRRLVELRNKGLRSGMKLLTIGEIHAELAGRRGESTEC